MPTAYTNEAHAAVFTALGFTNHPQDGNFAWDAATPSAGIIAAVTNLPVTIIGIVNLETRNTGGYTRDALITALAAVLDGTQQTALLTWQVAQWNAQCKIVYDASDAGFQLFLDIVNGVSLATVRQNLRNLLTAGGITRQPL